MPDRPVLLWLRQDLRLADHPALAAAVRSGRPVIPVYILDDETPGRWAMGGASRWWLGTSLPRLDAAFRDVRSRLVLRRGPAGDVLVALARETRAFEVYLSRAYEPWAARLETTLKSGLEAIGVTVHRFPGSLLVEPEEVRTKSGEAFRVYSPFSRAVAALPGLRKPLPPPRVLRAPETWPASLSVEELGLLPTCPDWAGGLRTAWAPGESGARARLRTFVDGPMARYAGLRDRPDLEGTSRLSPHLHFGEISPAACWSACEVVVAHASGARDGAEKFRRELLWREFSYHLLHHNPELPEKPFRREFEAFPWASDGTALDAWRRGLTGFPIVDAGMRELWQTGYMHNRVRMIVASFLVKDLLIPWQEGQAWFWDTLVDADLASNAASWQWVAGCGADAAPYFRIFNPLTQAIKFDPEGAYVRRYVPELARLPAPEIHAPASAPANDLEAAGVVLGKTYPHAIVDHAMARRLALEAFARLEAG